MSKSGRQAQPYAAASAARLARRVVAPAVGRLSEAPAG